jgi:hypothetical protein
MMDHDTKSILRSLAHLPSSIDLTSLEETEGTSSPRSIYRKRIEEMSQLRRLSQSVIVERKPDEEIQKRFSTSLAKRLNDRLKHFKQDEKQH